MALLGDREDRIFEGAKRAGRFFMREGDVHQTLERVVRDLEEIGVPYALVGAMALNEYGYRRLTEDVDLLLTSDGLATFKAKFLGKGYLEKFPGSRSLRDVETGVGIDIVIAGHFPGDGKPKPVAFPDPAVVAERGARLSLLPLPKLLELKLASGISAPHRLKDLADVLEVIRAKQLPRELASELDPYVQDKYVELWTAAQQAGDDEP